MISIDSDDIELERLLRQLEMLAEKEGAFLHPALRVVVRDGNLCMESEASVHGALVRLPLSCLIPVDGIKFRLDGASIEVESCSRGVSGGQQALLECLLAIYNQGNKLELHRKSSPWSAFAASGGLLDKLFSARSDAPKIRELHALARAGDSSRLLLKHYLGSRTLQYVADEDHSFRVLMPFIDFFNHHSGSPGFAREGAALKVEASHPLSASEEAFVCYSPMIDAMDTFLSYGFVDASAQFVRSVPLDISLPGLGAIVIEGRGGVARKNPPPPSLADLRHWVPRFTKGGEGRFILSGMVIPGPGNILAMHRILGFVIQKFFGQGLDLPELRRLTEAAAEQVVEANQEYYAELAAIQRHVADGCASMPAMAGLEQLIELQQRKLGEFEEAYQAFVRKQSTTKSAACKPGSLFF